MSLWDVDNKFELSPKNGRKEFGPAENLLNIAKQYFEWCEENPLMAKEAVKYKGETTILDVPKIRAFTLTGFCIFIRVGLDTFIEWSKRDEYAEVCGFIKNVIYEQKFVGAAADLLNANLIARDLGLADKKDTTMKMEYTDLSEAELDAKIKELDG